MYLCSTWDVSITGSFDLACKHHGARPLKLETRIFRACGRDSRLASGGEGVYLLHLGSQEGTAGRRLIIYSIPWAVGSDSPGLNLRRLT